MLTVHHLENSRSQRVLWLLEELGLPYEVKRYERERTMRAPAALRAVHPLGKSPILTDANRTIVETGAIVTYILDADGTGRLLPERGSDAWWTYQQLLHHAEGSAMPPLLLKLIFGTIARKAPFPLKLVVAPVMRQAEAMAVTPDVTRLLDWWESLLRPTGWFAGPDFSAADVMMSFPIEAGAGRLDFTGRSALKNWLASIHARPAYKAALAKGGPYAYA